MTSQKALQWKKDLEAWSIPKEIIDQAEESPWIHPPVLFQLPKTIVDTFSHQKAGHLSIFPRKHFQQN